MRILAVDDEKNVRLMLDECLTSDGHTVETAIGGEHAVEKFAQSGYDLVLLDMKMPGLNGIEALRCIKRLAHDVPVIMITGYGSIETAVETMKLGAVDYLRKPFTPEDIRSAVAAVAKRRAMTEDDAHGVTEELAFAKKCIEARELEKAANYLKRVIAADPGQPEAFNLLGVLSELDNDLAGAQRMYRAALALAPDYRPARENLDRTAQMRYSREGMSLGEPACERKPESTAPGATGR